MRLSLRETKICMMRVVDIISKTGDENNIEFYSYISCRYDRDFEKIENKSPYDQSNENEIYAQRYEFFSRVASVVRRHLNLYPSDIGGRAIETIKNITGKYHVWGYMKDTHYKYLHDDVYYCYEVLCNNDPGNAKKLTEFFLSDLFRNMRIVLKWEI